MRYDDEKGWDALPFPPPLINMHEACVCTSQTGALPKEGELTISNSPLQVLKKVYPSFVAATMTGGEVCFILAHQD
jgi:hypothetical protein